MKLKSLTLENIRTYSNATIEFPENSTLLSGDIGSGKSSILLAIEFALFGIMRGELSGESILRKESNEASVTLTFSLGEKEIEIQRRLKKGARGIQQIAGYVKEDGVKTSGSAIELKSKILDLLGYPPSLLTGKNLLYRYTVYTPQEELKRIILEDKDLRLDVLRKVLTIDKYKLIKNNMQFYLSFLRDSILQAEAKLEVLSKKKADKLSIKEEIDLLSKKMEVLLPQKKDVLERKTAQKEKLVAIEETMEVFRKKKQELQLTLQKQTSLLDRIKRLEEQQVLYSKKLEELKDLPAVSVDTLKKQAQLMEGALSSLEDKYTLLLQQKARLEGKVKTSEEIKEKFSELTSCPTCLQEVGPNHKHTIFEEQNLELARLEKEIAQIPLIEVREQRKQQQTMIDEIKNKLRESELLLYKQKQKEEYNRYLEVGKRELAENKELLLRVEKEVSVLKETLLDSPEENYLLVKKGVEALLDEEAILLQKLTQVQTSLEDKKQNYEHVKKEIEGLLLIEQVVKKQKSLHAWIKEHLLNLLEVIEKHVFFRIQQEFNQLFMNWFNILIEDEHMQGRIDDGFSPIVEQNGYEIEFSDLSGGEKSSVALAYRLALNNVINTLVSGIKTTDLLVLDEPTDGFSTQQLDKLRDVLAQIQVSQLILVSHEPKIESFVQNVIRIEKHDGVSRVIAH